MAILTLLTTKGAIHTAGGLNWGGNPNNHTTPLDAYIPIHIKTIRANPGLFLPKDDVQRILTFTWDDGVIMQGLFEASITDSKTGLIYPKQISSTPHKNTLGRYFRTRLGVSTSHRISLQDLLDYGRTNIQIENVGVDQYNLDFSV